MKSPAKNGSYGENAVVVDRLVKRYGDIHAVRDISFTVHGGEIFGLLGPNGAGKTSTIEVLEGFRSIDGGNVRVLGYDPTRSGELRQLRRNLGVVLQQTSHYRFLTVRETLAMHHAYYDNPRSVDEILELVGLADVAEQSVRQTSGGQQRRLDVGVALVGRPELVFLDEPTTGFDPAARRKFWDTIAGLRDVGTTIVLTTHYMEEAQYLADRVAVMSKGMIVGIGTPTELANQLSLNSIVRFVLPEGLALEDLPEAARGDQDASGVIEISTNTPTALLAALCGWACEQSIELSELELRSPSLEETYLTLTTDEVGVAQ